MTKNYIWIARLLLIATSLALTGVPQLVQAQSATQNPPAAAPSQDTQQPATDQNAPQPQPAQQPNRGLVNPSQGPLEPVPPSQNLPEAPSSTQQQTATDQTGAATPSPSPQAPSQPPAGVAVGRAGTTEGGPASRPAGAALAPAKQRQMRSLFLKIGAIAAAGVAIGTVVALTKGSPSNPPGAK